ncbi:hypothetical protein QBC34DRAFT_418833 [Podospora aff. communis PSN243]|uniref:AA1-like domain-containing protein n=1 Tax=Podospora aff. communis PSN243 TaxID=3040156 RepID=A0AAV9G5I9_9PEZI|nr:hypothetical protein QBC34DRAFT_418833 [Podospora aff. communis PSN243]
MRPTSLFPLATIAIAIVSPRQQSTDCILPSWSVHSASATYSDESLAPGKGSFVLTHHLTNITEKIDCALAFNTACRVTGTPADPQLQYQFQVNMDFSWVVFNKSWVCEGEAVDPKRPTFAYGYAEFTMKCPEEFTPTMTCTGLDLDAWPPLLVNGTVWVPEPEEEVELEVE